MPILESREPKVALPKAWPKIAKSAILHVLALAHLVITHVRGWCLNSPRERVRLRAENERLRSEVALLREELRIKDARLARVPPPNRPHYPPLERLAILVRTVRPRPSTNVVAGVPILPSSTCVPRPDARRGVAVAERHVRGCRRVPRRRHPASRGVE
jgi:hypothetical protein